MGVACHTSSSGFVKSLQKDLEAGGFVMAESQALAVEESVPSNANKLLDSEEIKAEGSNVLESHNPPENLLEAKDTSGRAGNLLLS